MKTFTTYAAKAKQFLNLLQGYTKGIRITAILILLLMGVSNAWAEVKGGEIYFDALTSGWGSVSSVEYVISHDSYSQWYQMANISNTQLYYISSASWGDAKYIAFTANFGWASAEGKKYEDRISWAPASGKYTKKNSYGVNSGSTYLFYASSSTNNATISTSSPAGYLGNGKTYTALNYTQTVQQHLSTDGGSNYSASTTALATVKVSSYKLNSKNTTTSNSGTIASGSSSATCSAARTATVTYTVSDVKTGYTFVGWYDDTTQKSDKTTYDELKATGAKNITARFNAKQSAITLNQENATTTGTTSVTATYGVTMPTIATLPTRNGYDFAGYFDAKSGGTKYYDADGSSAKDWDKTAATTLYAQWTAKNITINWNANGGSVTPTSSTYTYDGDAITLPTPSYAGHRFLGWFTADNGGTQITDVGTTNKPYTTVTYYAHWEVSIVEHKVTFGVGTNYTKYGTLTAATSSGSLTSGSNVVEGTSVTFTATPNTGYKVEGWYTNAACTSGKHDAGEISYTTSITGVTNVYVKFVEKTWSVAFAASTGGSIVEPASTPQTVGQITGATIIAEPAKGYTFTGWTSSNGGKFDDAKAEKTEFYPTAATTVTASFTENLYAISVKSSNENFGTVSPESGSAGIDTKVTITATPKLGYKFVNWTATNGITIADANSTTTTITASAAGTVTANFELIPPTTIYIKSDGNYADFKWNYDSKAYDMTPVDCGGTYYTANIAGGVSEIKITGSNNFTTTTLTVPTDDNILYDLTSTTHLYLKPNSNWTQSNARFAAYFFGDGEEWVNMTAGQSGLYEVTIPTGKSYTSVIFCRMNPASNTNGWTQDTQLWNQTNDLKIPTDGKNQYTVAAGAWNKGDGTWSANYDNNRWTTFDAPQLDVKIHITGKGSIVINDKTYTSDSKGTKSFTISKTINETITVGDITPAERWAYNNDAKIEMCDETITLATSHTITGPAAISLSFEQVSCEVVFNLNLPKGIIRPSWSIANQTVAMNGTATEPTSVGEIGEYLFGGWYTNGSTFNNANKYDFSTPVTGDLELYARWIPYAQCIFFKNNLKWKDVYVYTFSADAWDAYVGVKVKGRYIEYGKMTQIGQTDVYYYTLTNITTPFSHIAFSETDMHNNNEFYGSKAIYRGDRSDQMPLFIPQTDQTASTTNSTKYYSSGIWMKYNSTESGYEWRGATSEDEKDTGWNNSFAFTASKPGGYTFKASVTFGNIDKRFFKIHNIKDDWFGNGGEMDQDNCTNWIFGSDNSKNAKIKPTVTGAYNFTIYLGDGEVSVSLDYPLSNGDYRLVYVDDSTGVHPGHYIKKRNENRLDTVSFFVHHQNSPRILLQHCSAISNSGVPTWKTDKEYQILKTGGADPATAMLPGKRKSDGTLYIGEGCGIDSTGVYNFILQQSNSTAEVITDKTHPYVGDFYIRTDAADGGWDAFRQAGNKITYSSFADSHSNFNHYYCKYIDAGRNVKFTIANDYSYCISDTLDNDAIIQPNQSSEGCLPPDNGSANVRFGWDSNTNEISRAYIKGAGQTSDRFLVLQGNEHLKDANGKEIPVGTGNRYGLNANEEILVDQQNWIYQVDVTANNATQVKLIAEYNGTTQYFKGNETEYTGLLSSTASDDYKIRLVYDFKSNHLVIAWLAGGDTVVNTEILGADMMVIRRDQQPADQLNFNPQNSSMTDVKTGYAVMTFTEDHITDDTKTARERSLYWVSFPFDVKISDVFGFGEYAEHWILQYYDGAERAEKGLFIDSGTYWKYIFDTDTKLKAGEGYVLVLDLNKIEFLHGATEVSLYFPSINPLTTISGELPTADTIPEHWCNIDREWTEGGTKYHHKYTDSHWNLIGVPGFADINFDLNVTKYHFMQNDASFYYYFNLAESTYAVEASHVTEFQAMYAYMVQFAGTIDWTSSTVVGATPTEPKLAARRYSDEQPEKVVLRLELAQGEEVADRTFVQLQQEDATANFDLSLDLTKIVNIGVSNIYTLTDSLKIQTAGNVLPFEETTVAVGVDIATAGEYTFRMPDGTEGMVVELIDYETNTTTNLLLDNYTVNLPTGSNETRFALSIKPEKTATSIESTTTPSDSNIRKFIIDGKLYLQKDGMLYDAQGKLMR